MTQQTSGNTDNSQAASKKIGFWKEFKNYLKNNLWLRITCSIILSVLFFLDKGWLIGPVAAFTSICFSILLASGFFFVFYRNKLDKKTKLWKLASIVFLFIVIVFLVIMKIKLDDSSSNHINVSSTKVTHIESQSETTNSSFLAGSVLIEAIIGIKDNIIFPILFTFLMNYGTAEIAEAKRKKVFEDKIKVSREKYPQDICTKPDEEVCMFMGKCFFNDSSSKYDVYVKCDRKKDSEGNVRKTKSHLLLANENDIKKDIVLEEDVKQLGWAFSRKIDKFMCLDIEYHVIMMLSDEKNPAPENVIHLRFCDWGSGKKEEKEKYPIKNEDKEHAYYSFLVILFRLNGVRKDSNIRIEDVYKILNMQEILGINVQTDPGIVLNENAEDDDAAAEVKQKPEHKLVSDKKELSSRRGYFVNAPCIVDNCKLKNDQTINNYGDHFYFIMDFLGNIILTYRGGTSKDEFKLKKFALGNINDISLKDSNIGDSKISLQTDNYSNIDIQFLDGKQRQDSFKDFYQLYTNRDKYFFNK